MIKKILFTFLLAFVCFFGINSVYAWSSFSNIDLYRGYAIGMQDTEDQYVGNVNIPHRLISYVETEDRFLYGIRVSNSINSNTYEKFTTLTVDIAITQNSVNGQPNSINENAITSFAVFNTNGLNGDGSCFVLEKTNSYTQWRCSKSFENYTTITGFNLRLGVLSNFTGVYPLGSLTKAISSDNGIYPYTNDIYLTYVGYDIVTSSDPNTQIIQDQLREQEKANKKLDELKDSINETNETLNDDDTSESTSEATEFFEGFDTNTHGLTGIITAPITLIGNITSSSCSPLQVPLPYVNENISLPCMSSIYSQYFGSFYDIYKIITFGIIAYWVCVRIFNLVKDFKNPEHDEIEVMDL